MKFKSTIDRDTIVLKSAEAMCNQGHISGQIAMCPIPYTKEYTRDKVIPLQFNQIN